MLTEIVSIFQNIGPVGHFAIIFSTLTVFLVLIAVLHVDAMNKKDNDWNYTVTDVLNPFVNTTGKNWREQSKRPHLFALSIGCFMSGIYFGSVEAMSGFFTTGILLIVVSGTEYGSHPLDFLFSQ